MVLNGDTIKDLMKKNILIKNGDLNNVHSSSYDLTTSEYILKIKNVDEVVSLIDVKTIDEMYEKVDISKGYEFKPGECLLVVLKDEFNMSNEVCGIIRGRTSFNRLGIFTTIQHINPGYQGKLNLTLINNSSNTYKIMPNIQIAQVVFEKMNDSVSDNLLYGKSLDKVYQNEDGLNGSKIYQNFIGKVVRHFKGNYYYIENICLDSETKEHIVVYRTLYDREDSNIWTRSAKMFFEPIDSTRVDNLTKQTHRFELVNDLQVDYTKLKKD